MSYFEVSGVSQKTGRAIKPKTIEAKNEARARAEAEENGMTVTSVVLLPELEPTDKQIDYAKSLGISIPKDANRKEASDLISNAVEWDEPADDKLREFADKLDIIFTKYTGEKQLYNHIWHVVPGGMKGRAAWFTYCLYRDLLPKRAPAVADSYEHPAIRAIAERAIQDDAVIDSISRYEGSNLVFFGQRTLKNGNFQEGGSNRTKAYKQISEMLRSDPTLGVPAHAERQPSESSSKTVSGNISKSSKVAAQKTGCMVTLATLITVSTALIAFMFWIVS